jgi:AAHS family benzoate transporter-like MFS transporter
MIYGISAWLPKLMSTAGYGINSSIGFLLVLNFGAIFGSLFGGWLADRLGLGRVLLCFLILSSLVLSLMAVKAPLPVLYALIAVAGGGTFGAQILANAFAVQYYPAHIRSTGLGWAMGIGRIGAIIGPMLGAAIHGAELPMEVSFLAFAIPGLIGASAIGVFIFRVKRGLHTGLDPQGINTLPSTSPSSDV